MVFKLWMRKTAAPNIVDDFTLFYKSKDWVEKNNW